MTQSIGIRSTVWETRASPYGDQSGDQKKRREQRMRQLIAALQVGELDAARLAFSALIRFDQDISQNVQIGRIRAALQSSDVHLAWQHAQHLRTLYPWAFPALSKAHTKAFKSVHPASEKTHRAYNPTVRMLDLIA